MKIVGNGLLASVFLGEDYGADVIIFASGVSKSTENSDYKFARERVLLKEAIAEGKKLIYFSTCSISNGSEMASPYVTHKLEMESLVLESSSNTIIRLPQVVGKSRNGTTLVNFFAKKILSQEPYQVESNTVRNIIDVDDVCRITRYILEENEIGVIHNCSLPVSFSVIEIVRQLELVLGVKSLHSEILGELVTYQSSEIVLQAINDGRLEFTSAYLSDTLFKYYTDFNSWVFDIK